MLQASHLEQILRQASRARLQAFTPALREAMQRFGIDRSLRRAAAFIAQVGHESGQFRWMQEIWGPTAQQKRYEPPSPLARRLGNTQRGDGARYKGRGPIQLTGRANYRAYGTLLGLDLEGAPEQAATPEVGFAIAGLYWQRNGLNELADADDFTAITRRINGGTNGLEERRRFYDLALRVLADVYPARATRARRAAASDAPRAAPEPLLRGAEAVRDLAPAAEGARRKPAGRSARPQRKLDARADTLDFRDLMYVPSLIEVPTHIPLGDWLDAGVPILDQGSEGACTGYGLATVCNYLLLRRRVVPDAVPVSARMLYHLARRYDEWPGEDYEGSSARGAMKGWHKHGVCPEGLYPSAGPDRHRGLDLDEARTAEARRRPLGAYFRVNHKDLVAMHSALAEVGEDGAIPLRGGHAFAIVAYDEQGFWLQNSWGPDWGAGGFARISYDDWLRNGTDAWVARLGAPVVLRTLDATATAHSAAARETAAYSFADLRPHIVSVGNEGRLRAGGEYGSTPASLSRIFEDDIPRVTAGWKKRRVLLYAHGGLVGESAAVQRLAEYRVPLLQGQVYPLGFVWKTDYWTTLANMLSDAVRRRKPEGVLDAAKDFMLDRLDDALEPLARALTGKASWDEMKENALAASRPGAAATQVVRHLQALQAQGGLELHLVAHSAGSIFLAPLLSQLAAVGIPVATCTLWAPACTLELFDRHYRPAIESSHVGRFALYVLSDKDERDDHCAHIYNKSLLYMVSHAFEDKPRIPGFRDGVALLGMERFLASVRPLLKGPHELIVARDGSGLSNAAAHGAFDDDEATVASTFARILGGKAGAAQAAGKGLQFRRSASSLRDRRLGIEAGSR